MRGKCLSKSFSSQHSSPFFLPRTSLISLPTADGLLPSPYYPWWRLAVPFYLHQMWAPISTMPFKEANQACKAGKCTRMVRGGERGGDRKPFPTVRHTQEAITNCVHGVGYCLFYELCFRGVEDNTRRSDGGWLSCSQDDVHCTHLSFTRNLMKGFPYWITTLSKLPLIWFYSVLPSGQNSVRKTQCGTELVHICHWKKFGRAVFPRGKDFWLWVIMAC